MSKLAIVVSFLALTACGSAALDEARFSLSAPEIKFQTDTIDTVTVYYTCNDLALFAAVMITDAESSITDIFIAAYIEGPTPLSPGDYNNPWLWIGLTDPQSQFLVDYWHDSEWRDGKTATATVTIIEDNGSTFTGKIAGELYDETGTEVGDFSVSFSDEPIGDVGCGFVGALMTPY